MLHQLTIERLGVIDTASLSLRSGLTVLTGETGAGKTMVLSGLALILGGKAQSEAVRSGHQEATAEAVYDLPAEFHEIVTEAGGTVDEDGTVTVVRVLGQSRSRSVLGGRSVPQALLAELGSHVVTVHGQADQMRLRTSATQRDVLDYSAGKQHAVLKETYRLAWQQWRTADQRLQELTMSSEAEQARLIRLRDDLDILSSAAVAPGERSELVSTISVLSHAESLRASASLAHEALAGESEFTAIAALESARKAIEEASRDDSSLEPLAERLAEYVYGVRDAAQELASYVDKVEADPSRLDVLQSRLAQISGLERRFACEADSFEALQSSIEAQLGGGQSWEEIVKSARDAEALARHDLELAAGALTESRKAAAQRLAGAVMAELEQLAMPSARFDVSVTASEAGPSGADTVTMLLAAHPGATPRPVADAASGGELSRIMLAIEVVLASTGDSGKTFVFDEVDAGVGGKAAQAVGQRLATLAEHHQVIVVTHLAQVAAWADHHIVIEKAHDGAVTVSQVREVSGEDRAREIARLLSGEEDSESARAHALELLEAARVAR